MKRKFFPLQVFDPIYTTDEYAERYDYDLLGNSVSTRILFLKDPIEKTNLYLRKYAWIFFLVISSLTASCYIFVFCAKNLAKFLSRASTVVFTILAIVRHLWNFEEPSYTYYKAVFQWYGLSPPNEQDFEIVRYMMESMAPAPIRDRVVLIKMLSERAKKWKKLKKKWKARLKIGQRGSDDEGEKKEDEDDGDQDMKAKNEDVWDEALLQEIKDVKKGRNKDGLKKFDGRTGKSLN